MSQARASPYARAVRSSAAYGSGARRAAAWLASCAALAWASARADVVPPPGPGDFVRFGWVSPPPESMTVARALEYAGAGFDVMLPSQDDFAASVQPSSVVAQILR